MAVREVQGRRMGGISEKLLTLEEAAKRLQCPAQDLERFIQSGRLPVFRLGGDLVRVRLQDVETLRGGTVTRNNTPPIHPEAVSAQGGSRQRIVAGGERRAVSLWERMADFVYFNDFYMVALLIILTLLALIFTL